MDSLSISDLTIRYGNFTAVKDVNLEVPAGEITALVGPSGCGKSTFLASLNRLTDLTPGCIAEGKIVLGESGCILGPNVNILKLRRRVGMVFQKPNPFPQSIRRNFEIPLREHGIPKREIADRTESALKDVGLWDEVSNRLDQSALQLSGGQQQRLCIARALALDPQVILFDEPCSALDPLASAVVEDHIAALRGRVTVIIVTHNLAQARRISDSTAIFWIRDGAGTIVEHGPAKTLFTSASDPDAVYYLSGERG
ncbi:phosphate ABC transporter ATP-binding protein [Verrucomicrobiales bacterium BCK34]|nr:phosphate ABC transporter ATP-binding protein [Verrucomicrobiales bacterium BCK34]